MAKIEVLIKEVRWNELEKNFENSVNKLYSSRRDKVLRYKNQKAAIVSLAAGLYLQKTMEKCYGICPEDLNVGEDEFGKPYVIGRPDIYFNISHSGDKIVIAHGDVPVGVDIEKLEESRYDAAVADRFFSPLEKEYIEKGGGNKFFSLQNMENYRFFIVWTMKEAYVKYVGTGLRTPLNSFRVKPEERAVEGVDVENTFCVEGEYVYSVCVEKNCQVIYCV